MKRVICAVISLVMLMTSGIFAKPLVLNGNENAVNFSLVTMSDNTNGAQNDPNSLPPKAKEAAALVRLWCNADKTANVLIIPHSRKMMKDILKERGFKGDIVTRAIEASGINWSEYALIRAKILLAKGYDERYIREWMKEMFGFQPEEISYAIANYTVVNNTSLYLNPADFAAMDNATRRQTLTAMGYVGDQVELALTYLSE